MQRIIAWIVMGLWIASSVVARPAAAYQLSPDDEFGGDLGDVVDRRATVPEAGQPDRPASPAGSQRLVEVFNPNLVRNGDFQSFQRPNVASPETASGNWGTGEYSRFGVSWASRNAKVRFEPVSLRNQVHPPGSETALRIDNQSAAAPHVFGTTAQRISLAEGTGRYRLSLWARGHDLKSAGALTVTVDRAWKVRPIVLAAGTYPWKYHTGVFDAKDVDTATKGYLDLRFISQDTGTAEITGVTLQRAVEGEAERFHAVLVFDDASNVAQMIAADKRMIVELVATMFAGRGDMLILEGNDATPDNILKRLRTLPSQPSDSVFFYYAGHGGTEVKRGHALTLTRGILYRSDLQEALAAVPAQLKVIVTDCCANQFEAKAVPKIVPRVFHPDVVHGLFLRQRGMVDLTASSPGEFAVGNEYGGLMARNFIQTLQLSAEDLDRKGLGVVTWTEFVDQVRTATNADYQQARELALRLPADHPIRRALVQQARQEPFAFQLNAIPVFRMRTPR